jgi:hypothetical protein
MMSNATQAAAMAKSMGGGRPTYIAIFVTGSIFPLQSSGGSCSPTTCYYIMQVPSGGGFTAGGGDESKKQWFIRIGNLTEAKYLECSGTAPHQLTSSGQPCTTSDDFNLTPFALETSLFGQLLPFRHVGYLYTTGSGTSTSIAFSPNYTFGSNGAPPIEAFSYPSNFIYKTNSTGPFKLAYVSPSLSLAEQNSSPCPGNSQLQCFNAILLYQVV